MKKLLFAIAGAASFAALAADPAARSGDISLVGFESYTADQTVIGYGDDGQTGNSLWSCAGDDASLVKAYGNDNATAPTGISFPAPFEDAGDNYLALDTNGSELQRAIPAAGQTVAADGTYIDTLVQFTPSESAPTSTDLAGAKLAIWLGVVENVTNLYVQGAYYDSSDGQALTVDQTKAYKLNKSCEPNTWYRLTVKAYGTIGNAAAVSDSINLPAFSILIDGEELTTSDAVYSQAGLAYLCPGEGDGSADDNYLDADMLAAFKAGKIIPSCDMTRAAATLTSVGFKGTGALDDFVVTTEAPDFTPAAIDFSLTWPAGLTAVSYQIGENAPVAISGTSPFAVPGLAAGDVVKFIVANADGAQKTLTGTAGTDTGLDATGTTFGWPEYLGEAVAGAYTIDDFADLDMLRKGVAAGLTTANETFKQTADIDMTSAGAFAGIGTYSKVPTAGTPFLGTYDGQNYMIANVQRAGENTQGIFNQVGPSGVIENLVVSNMYWDTSVTGEYGFAIVGNAGGGATLRNLTAAGTFASASKPSTHNIAGIAVRLSPGATAGAATTVDSCTNNATIYGGYTKLGGINAIVQNQTGFVDGKVVFVNCANNGALVCKRTATDVTGNAGIVGYFSGTNVELTDCYGNGVITNEDGANTDKDGALVGWTNGGTIKDNGGNAAPVGKKMIGTWGGATETGFLYATVDNGVATTVTTLAKDTTYLLEGSVAASETPVFTLAAEGDYIEFDTALGYTFAGTIGGTDVTNETTGTVIKYWIPAAGGDDYVVEIEGSDVVITPQAGDLEALAEAGVDTNSVAAVNAALATTIEGTSIPAWQALFLGVAPTTNGLETVAIKSISFNADGNVEVVMADGVTLKTGRGVDIKLKLMGSSNLTDWTLLQTATDSKAFTPVQPAQGETKKFYKVVVDFAGSQN